MRIQRISKKMRKAAQCHRTGLGYAKVVSGAKNAGRVLYKQRSGSKRQAAEQTVGWPIV